MVLNISLVESVSTLSLVSLWSDFMVSNIVIAEYSLGLSNKTRGKMLIDMGLSDCKSFGESPQFSRDSWNFLRDLVLFITTRSFADSFPPNDLMYSCKCCSKSLDQTVISFFNSELTLKLVLIS
eukprot:NODE_725_length_4780_cov_0.211066.p3 type:complete len:124 gc:universal NODE_725_length_4780_cov_0.211066:3141-3512(+)